MTDTQSIYTREDLVELDKTCKLIPIVFDPCFKGIFLSNKNALKRLIISSLHLEKLPEDTKMTFGPNELLKENHKEYQKVVDMHAILNDNMHISVEINTEQFKNVKLRNFLLQTKLFSTLLEKGEKVSKLKDVYLFQLNINTRGKNYGRKENIIVPYDITKKEVYHENFVIVLKYLEVYRKLYYNGDREEETVWLAALTAKTFTEIYDILRNILEENELDKFIGDVIRMSKDEFVLHEWEKEKLDALVEYEKISNAQEEGKIEGKIEGKKEEKIEIAKNMLAENIDIETITKVTGLTKEEIEELK